MSKKFNPIEWVGTTINNKFIIEFVDYTGRVPRFKYKHTCGNVHISDKNRILKNSSVYCPSCRALTRRSKKGDAGLQVVYRTYKYSAKKRNYEFSLTREQLKEITLKNCYYCNREPSAISMASSAYKNQGKAYTLEGKENSKFIHNGIDRVDNTKGYVLENCVPCCSICNKAKQSMSLDEFKTFIKSVYNFMKLG